MEENWSLAHYKGGPTLTTNRMNPTLMSKTQLNPAPSMRALSYHLSLLTNQCQISDMEYGMVYFLLAFP